MVIWMCGMLGTGSPTWWMVTPALNLAALISRPEMNWLDFDALTNTSPPVTSPVASIMNGRRPVPRSWIVTPRSLRDSMTVAIGRRRACASPSKVISPWARQAAGGRKRMTVPASPTSMLTGPRMKCGVTVAVRFPTAS